MRSREQEKSCNEAIEFLHSGPFKLVSVTQPEKLDHLAIVLDNGPEFRGRALAAWSEERGVQFEWPLRDLGSAERRFRREPNRIKTQRLTTILPCTGDDKAALELFVVPA